MPEGNKLAYRMGRIEQLLKNEDIEYISGVIDLQDAITFLYGGIIQRFQLSCEVSSAHIAKVVAPAFMKHDKIKHKPGEPIKVLRTTLCNSGTALPLIGISNPDALVPIKNIDIPMRTKTRWMHTDSETGERAILAYDVNLGHKFSEVNSAQWIEEQFQVKKQKDVARKEEKWSGKGKPTDQTG